MKNSRLLPGLLTLALASPAAQAMTVSAVGSFANPTASSLLFFQMIRNQDNATNPQYGLPSNTLLPGQPSANDSLAYFGWGIDVLESWALHEKIQSHFWFNGVGSVDGGTAANVTSGQIFSLGTFTYTNEQTILSGGIVNINFNLNLTVDGLNLAERQYQIEINNTRNQSATSYDTATIINSPGDLIFNLNGTDYELTILGFLRDPLVGYETWTNLDEDAQTSAQIFASITAVTPIPVPAAAWLFGSGLLALFGLKRKSAV